MQEKDEDLLAQKKMPDGQKEEISQVCVLNITYSWKCGDRVAFSIRIFLY
jgi:hypothetical protein